jgi:hypothetical protein
MQVDGRARWLVGIRLPVMSAVDEVEVDGVGQLRSDVE